MATLIPSFYSCSQRMTAGERRFAQRLEEKLEDDYLIWYDVPIGAKRLHPDFIVLHPDRGLFILEVKDWKLDTICAADAETIRLLTASGEISEKNPLEQARRYAFAVTKILEVDPHLRQQEGRHQGKLCCPYGYGVVFANITRNQFESSEGLSTVLPPHLVLCKDEFFESVDPLDFQQRLWDLSAYQFGDRLSSEQIDRVRWHLFPEMRPTSNPVQGIIPGLEPTEVIPDIIRIMDLQQEQLARSLGEGHRVIHGVAGSGKTLILAFRCQHLAQVGSKPILVLCFNVALAAKLRQMMVDKGLSDRVKVKHFHGWCAEQLRAYHLPTPDFRQYQGDAYVEQLVQRVVDAVSAGVIPSGRYGAVMIDEGHDFKAEWFKLTAQMVDPETNSLLILYDDAQNLYGSKKQRNFSFKEVGIQAQGRTTILKINYRNTQEILTVAYEFAREVMMPSETTEEDSPVLVEPLTAGRHGRIPELVKLPGLKQEADYLIQRVRQLHEKGTAWNEMAIAYRFKFIGEKLYQQLKQADIPVEWLNQSGNSRDYHPGAQSIKLMTMHSSKGLEFPVVLIPGVGYLPNPHGEPEEEARLLYVAMTRAIDQLVMTCHQSSEFVGRLEAALQKVV